MDLRQNSKLNELVSGYNQFKRLDLSYNPELHDVSCTNTPIEELNLKNILVPRNFYFTDNESLNCVEVDDPDWFYANMAGSFDQGVTFAEDCEY